MRRIIATCFIVGLVAGFLFGATPAQAAAPSCSTRSNNITSWSFQNDLLNGHVDSHCGGAQPGNQGSYYIKYSIQYQSGGAWAEPNCDNGPCDSIKPPTGTFSAGNDHNFNWTFNLFGQLQSGVTWRPHTEIVFPNYQPNPGYTIAWNGPEVTPV